MALTLLEYVPYQPRRSCGGAQHDEGQGVIRLQSRPQLLLANLLEIMNDYLISCARLDGIGWEEHAFSFEAIIWAGCG